jgi:hypothetical protein
MKLMMLQQQQQVRQRKQQWHLRMLMRLCTASAACCHQGEAAIPGAFADKVYVCLACLFHKLKCIIKRLNGKAPESVAACTNSNNLTHK